MKALELLQELLAIPSPTGEEGPIADWVEQLCRNQGKQDWIKRSSNSLIAGLRAPQEAPSAGTILLAGHLDTVRSPNQYQGQIRGERLHGLGASDMKAGVALMLEILLEPLVERQHDLLFVFYEREEGPYLENGLGPLFEQYGDLLRSANLAVCLEPTDNLVQIGCLGTLHADLRFAGERAHSARPWFGRNAIHRAGALLQELEQLQPVDHWFGNLCYREVLNVTTIDSHQARNVIPDFCKLGINYRFAPGKSIEQACAEVRKLAERHGADELHFPDLCPSGRVCLEHPLIQSLIDISQAAPQAKQAWTDVAQFAAQGIDAVNFGPGQAAQAHKADEYIELPALQIGRQHLHRWLQTGRNA